MNTPILNRVRLIVADTFSTPAEQITLASSPDTIETWDSLQHLNLMLALEQEFGLQLTPEEIEQLLSVEQIVALLSTRARFAETTP
jgi:acyl carrier protein